MPFLLVRPQLWRACSLLPDLGVGQTTQPRFLRAGIFAPNQIKGRIQTRLGGERPTT